MAAYNDDFPSQVSKTPYSNSFQGDIKTSGSQNCHKYSKNVYLFQ